ncbi:hypothetical protein ACQPTN_40605 [Bradyrhizobium sp. 13971]
MKSLLRFSQGFERLPDVAWRLLLDRMRQPGLERPPILEHLLQQRIVGDVDRRLDVADGFELAHIALSQDRIEVFQAFVIALKQIVPSLGAEVIVQALDGVV